MDKKFISVHYAKYLELEKILNAQHLRSEEVEKYAHDEMLFIIVHQVYELWFKQIIHELSSIKLLFEKEKVAENSIGLVVSRIERVITITQHLIGQIRIMETMTPLDFLDFRKYLFPASGFQSLQFRKIEVILGLKESRRLSYHSQSYRNVFTDKQQQELAELEKNPSLLQLTGSWLERIPFLDLGEFHFRDKYSSAVEKMIKREKSAILDEELIDEEQKDSRLKMLEKTESYYKNMTNPDSYQKALEEGQLNFSHQAMLAALFIHLYRDEPILRLPFELLIKLSDLDELLTAWRYRHAQMVLRMLGRKTGTGGSSGYDYLRKTAEKHHIFPDLHYISTLLIPRSELPELPESLKRQLGFYFSSFK